VRIGSPDHRAYAAVLPLLDALVELRGDRDGRRAGRQVGTPICIPTQGGVELGRIASIELNHKAVDSAKRGDSVALKLEATNAAESSRAYGRHFDHKARRSKPCLPRMLARVIRRFLACTLARLSRWWARDTRRAPQDPLVSRISRKSIDLLKLHFREQMEAEHWRLVVKLKKILGVD